MAQTYKFGKDGQWATKKGSTLAYSDTNNAFKPLPFSFERNSIATRVNKEGLIEVVGNDIPRIDYTDSTEGALLLENSATNFIPYSEDFTQWSKIGGVVVTNDFAISPNGTQNASKLVYNGTTSGRVEKSTSASGTVTQSVYLKTESGTQEVSIGMGSSTLTEVTVTNEWQRFEFAGSGSYPRILCNDVATIYAWGAMLEANSVASSYIPTNGSTVQRAAETCNESGNSEVFNSEGVLFANIAANANDGTFRVIALNGASTNLNSDRVQLYFRSDADKISFYIENNNNNEFLRSIDVNVKNYNKVAFKYGNTTKVYINGFNVAEGSGVTIPSNLQRLDFNEQNGGNDYYGKTKELGYYDTALTDAELEKLTSYRSLNEMVTELNLNAL